MTTAVGSAAPPPPPPPEDHGKKKVPASPVIVEAKGSAEHPQTQGADAPAAAKKAAILYLPGFLHEPAPEEADAGLMAARGAYYLAQQQANRQHQNPPKDAYDNVFMHSSPRRVMDAIKATVTREQQEIERHGTPQSATERSTNYAIIRAENRAVQEEGPAQQSIDWSQYSKIYIPGYGQAGSRIIQQGQQNYTADDIAERLIASGALAHITDIRITSSGSADSQWTGTEQPAHQPTGEVPYNPNWLPDAAAGAIWMGLSAIRGAFNAVAGAMRRLDREAEARNNEAFAQEVSRALARRGYTTVTVTGYMGEEMPLRDARRDHHHRATGQDPEPRRSLDSVRIRFQNGRRVTPAPAAPAIQFPPPDNEGDDNQ